MKCQMIAKNCVIMDKAVKPFKDSKGIEREYYTLCFKQESNWNIDITCSKDVFPYLKVGETQDLLIECSESMQNRNVNKLRVVNIGIKKGDSEKK